MTQTEPAPTHGRRLQRARNVAAGAALAIAGAGVGAGVALAFTARPQAAIAARGASEATSPASEALPSAGATAESAPRQTSPSVASSASAASAADCGDRPQPGASGEPAPATAAGFSAAAPGPNTALPRSGAPIDPLRQRLEEVLGAKGRVEPDRDGGLRFVAAETPMPRSAAATGAVRPASAEVDAGAPTRATGRTATGRD